MSSRKQRLKFPRAEARSQDMKTSTLMMTTRKLCPVSVGQRTVVGFCGQVSVRHRHKVCIHHLDALGRLSNDFGYPFCALRLAETVASANTYRSTFGSVSPAIFYPQLLSYGNLNMSNSALTTITKYNSCEHRNQWIVDCLGTQRRHLPRSSI